MISPYPRRESLPEVLDLLYDCGPVFRVAIIPPASRMEIFKAEASATPPPLLYVVYDFWGVIPKHTFRFTGGDMVILPSYRYRRRDSG